MNISSIIICFRLKIFIYIFIKKNNNIYIETCEKYIHLNDNDDNEYKIIKESFNDTLINLKINYNNLYKFFKLSLIYETFYENNILTSKYNGTNSTNTNKGEMFLQASMPGIYHQ